MPKSEALTVASTTLPNFKENSSVGHQLYKFEYVLSVAFNDQCAHKTASVMFKFIDPGL